MTIKVHKMGLEVNTFMASLPPPIKDTAVAAPHHKGSAVACFWILFIHFLTFSRRKALDHLATTALLYCIASVIS